MMTRHYSLIDKLISQVDDSLRTLWGEHASVRTNPATHHTSELVLSEEQQRESAGYMRVNHTGEVCAQALYRGQALAAKDPAVKALLLKCSDEETDHLAWCAQRLNELHSHTSYLNIFWYFSSLQMGFMMGLVGDPWSLGFVEETEKQVGRHLTSHLEKLSPADEKSRAIVTQMLQDEAQHGETAKQAGARELPEWFKFFMTLQAKIMTSTAYYL